MKVELSKYDNSWYHTGASKLKIVIWIFIDFFLVRNPLMISMTLKKIILKLFGAKIGKGVWIKPGVKIKYPWKLEIGNYCWIGEDVWIDNLGKVIIKDNVVLSQGAMLLCGNHDYKKTTFDLIVGNILLEEGVWVGAKSVVCGGVICKNHSVLTVNSVATKDLSPFKIYAGNPCQYVRTRRIEKQ